MGAEVEYELEIISRINGELVWKISFETIQERETFIDQEVMRYGPLEAEHFSVLTREIKRENLASTFQGARLSR